MVRFGVIGCGGISRWHIGAIGSIPDAKLTAVCDELPERARAAGEEYGVSYYSDLSEFLQSGLADAVCICTPSGLHADICIRALRHGLHTAVEKPLAITRESLQEVLIAERKSGKKLTVLSQLRYGDGLQCAKEIIRTGGLGKITMADLSMKYFREPSYYSDNPWRGTLSMDGGGALMNQGIHGLDLLCWLCDGVSRVFCLIGTLTHDIETEDTLSAVLTLSNGALGVLTATTSCYPGQERRLEICGTEGSMTLVEDTLVFLQQKDGTSYRGVRTQDSGTSNPFAISFELHKRQLAGFVSCIINDTPPPVNAADAAATLNVAFSLYESAATGLPIMVH